MRKEVALRICREAAEKKVELIVVPLPVAVLLLDLEERVEELERRDTERKLEDLE